MSKHTANLKYRTSGENTGGKNEIKINFCSWKDQRDEEHELQMGGLQST